MSTSRFLDDKGVAGLERLLGAENVRVSEGPESRVIAQPRTPEVVAELIAWSAEQRIPVACGSAQGAEYVQVDLSSLRNVRFYEAGDLTIGVDAGFTVDALNALLATKRQFLPLDIAGAERKTVGSVLATHASGPLRHSHGTVRDFTIGIEFVSSEGKLVRAGGRVVKNVAGYDLMKLLIGSHGSLGIITGANFKVFPQAQETETMLLPMPSWEAVELMRTALLHSPLRPLAVEFTNVPLDRGASDLLVLVRYAGPEAVRKRYRTELSSLATRLATECEQVEDDAAFWTRYPKNAAVLPDRGSGVVRLSAPSASSVELLQQFLSDAPAAHFAGRLLLGVFALSTAPSRQWCGWPLLRRSGGYLTSSKAPSVDTQRPPDTAAELMMQLKREFDPNGIFPPVPMGTLAPQ